MKKFLIVYTENKSIGSDQVYNMFVTAQNKSAAIEQARERIGDTIIIINIIEL